MGQRLNKPPKTTDLKSKFESAVQRYMDAKAAERGYGDEKIPPLASAVTYADEPAVPKFQNEGKAFRAWRSLVWEKCYAIMDEVIAGTREIPTEEQLIAELPALNLA